jgi:hypothetical protein
MLLHLIGIPRIVSPLKLAVGGAALIVMDSALLPVPAELVAVTVKLVVVAAFGVPEIAPVLALSEAHVGRLPTVTLHVHPVQFPPVSPVALRICR